jgi:hypothetical protein
VLHDRSTRGDSIGAGQGGAHSAVREREVDMAIGSAYDPRKPQFAMTHLRTPDPPAPVAGSWTPGAVARFSRVQSLEYLARTSSGRSLPEPRPVASPHAGGRRSTLETLRRTLGEDDRAIRDSIEDAMAHSANSAAEALARSPADVLKELQRGNAHFWMGVTSRCAARQPCQLHMWPAGCCHCATL